MIWYWLITALRRLRWLFVLPTARDVARIDSNAPCPACGARSGKLLTKQFRENEHVTTVHVQHTCEVCQGVWYEQPVVKAGPTKIRSTEKVAVAEKVA